MDPLAQKPAYHIKGATQSGCFMALWSIICSEEKAGVKTKD